MNAAALLRPSRQDVTEARRDLAAFGRLIGWPLEPWQSGALSLTVRQTVLISPRQCGKSRSLAVLASWWAFRRPKQLVLIVSAGEDAAGRLLRSVREITGHPLLAGSVEDETQHRVILSNGSEIRSVPASDKQVRGWTVDLLLVDEAAFVSEDLLMSAALPTTAARPEARIVLASTPWGDSGPFYTLAHDGLNETNVYTRTFRWKLADAWWIAAAVIETARATMSPLRFKAEYEGEWVPAGDAYFSHDDLLAAVAGYPMTRSGYGGPAVAGLDWGRQQDAHAIALAGLLQDYGVNGRPVVVVPWAETSRRPYAGQVGEVTALAGLWDLTVVSETNGVGAYPSEELAQKLIRTRVIPVSTTQSSKEDAYGRVSALLAERGIVLPDHPEMLRQLGGVSAQPTPSGGLRIAARHESMHDDIPDALSLAVAGLPRQLADVPAQPVPDGTQWCETPAGVRVPVPVRTLTPEASYLHLYGTVIRCGACGLHYSSRKDTCQWCNAANPDPPARPSGPAKIIQATAIPVPNAYAPDLMKCPAGHTYLHTRHPSCPRCGPGGSPAGQQAVTAPPALTRALALRVR